MVVSTLASRRPRITEGPGTFNAVLVWLTCPLQALGGCTQAWGGSGLLGAINAVPLTITGRCGRQSIAPKTPMPVVHPSRLFPSASNVHGCFNGLTGTLSVAPLSFSFCFLELILLCRAISVSSTAVQQLDLCLQCDSNEYRRRPIAADDFTMSTLLIANQSGCPQHPIEKHYRHHPASLRTCRQHRTSSTFSRACICCHATCSTPPHNK